MSSAELQSLMSQLQAQRQGEYSESNLDSHSNINLHADNYGFKWTYIDGTEGDDKKEPIEGRTAARQRKISKWQPNIAINKAGDRFFKEFVTAKPGENGSIDYSDVGKDDMALTIAWEKMWRGRAEQERNVARKELHSMKTGNVSAHPHKGGAGAFSVKTGPDGEITITPGAPVPAHAPKKKAKKQKMAKQNPDEATQLAIWEKSQMGRGKRDKSFQRKEFVPRKPGTYGPQQKDEPYPI